MYYQYYFLFFFNFYISFLVDGLSYNGTRFNYQLFNENGSNIIWKNDHFNFGSNFWLRLNPIEKSTENIYWLNLEIKQTSQFPILIHKNEKRIQSIQTDTQVNKCLYSAATYLIPYKPFSSSYLSKHVTTEQIEKEIKFLYNFHSKTEQRDYLTISFCGGISGVVQLYNSTFYVSLRSNQQNNEINVQILSSVFVPHQQSSLNNDQLKRGLFNAANNSLSRHLRIKRSFHMPVRNMPGPFLVELYIIVDSKMASTFSSNNYADLIHRVAFIMNQINLVFSEFNIYFTVVQLEIWEHDQIKLSYENHILMELQLYKRRFIHKRHDCLHAILGENLGTSRRGQSEPASMCGYNRCVGYTKDYFSQNNMEISHAVLHEIGHNFGLHHDTEQCKCYGCIMATGIEAGSYTFNWSNCSKHEINSLLKSGMADCLLDEPPSNIGKMNPVIMKFNRVSQYIESFVTSNCGNGVVDDGEQCDCGGRKRCESDSNKCCNPNTCRFKIGASCAGGSCCDLNTCSLKKSGTICRDVGLESCDLPEFCNGKSEWCPGNVFKQDGISCKNNIYGEWSHCYRGKCSTRQSQCKLLWGDTGQVSDSICYNLNSVGDVVGNCGLEIPREIDRDRQPQNWSPKICLKENKNCGRLWCSHDNERVLRLSEQFTKDELVNGYHCSAVRFDMDWYLDDSGMVPNGVSCGSSKMCWKGECVSEASIDFSRCYCHGHGDCNNRGNCHCHPGFSPPNCTVYGDGGSFDSGPAPKFNYNSRIITSAILISVIVILTILVIFVFIYHYRNRTWPYLVSFIECPNYKKTVKDDFKSLSRENHCPNTKRPFVLNIDTKYISNDKNSPLYSPKSPKSPDRTMGKPLPVKERAQFLENNKQALKEKSNFEAICSKPDPEIKNKPINLSSNEKPAILSKKPIIAHVSKGNTNQSFLNRKPPILSAKPEKPSSPQARPAILSEKSQKALVSELRPPLLSKKPQKSMTVAPPAIIASKPKKPVTDNESTNSYLSDSKYTSAKNIGKPVKPLKYQISNPKLEHSSNLLISDKKSSFENKKAKEKAPPILIVKPQKSSEISDLSTKNDSTTHLEGMHTVKLARPLKFQISQPRLEETTCTDATRDLPNVDKTLVRNVAPHKILKCDHPSNAVNFYN